MPSNATSSALMQHSKPDAMAYAVGGITPCPRYSVEDVTDFDGVRALGGPWKALEETSQGSTVFQSYELCLTWLENYVFGQTPSHAAHILAFRDSDARVVALAPLVQRLSGIGAMAEWVGEPLVQYGDILMDPSCDRAALKQALSAALAELPVPGLHLRNVRADARVHDVLDLSGAEVGERRETGIADLQDFDTAQGYFDSLSKREKKNRRTKRRQLSELGTLSHETVEPSPQAAELCGLAIDWKIAWLARRGLSSRAFMDCRALKTLRSLCGRERASNPATLFVLKLDGEPIAIEVGFVGPEGYASFMGTYHPRMENLSAGKVQKESTIIHGFDAGWRSYDMLAPLSDYKASWSTRRVAVVDYLKPTRLTGRLYREGYLRTVWPVAKTVWNALPATARSHIVRFTNHQAA